MLSFTIALSAWLLRFDPALLAERMTGIGRRDQKAWDKVLLAFTAIGFFAWFAVMGIDARRGWSRVPAWGQALGAVALLASFGVFFVTFRANTFLSPAVRVQWERAQTVVSTGPYGYVRHPLYAGFVPYALGTALLLGSWPGVLGGLVLILLVARRAVLEEQVLQAELEGYRAYTDRVKYRFVPYVW
jgi:protein-S-isoprenylcysteine O-methyltransferase Ste14